MLRFPVGVALLATPFSLFEVLVGPVAIPGSDFLSP